MGAGVGPANQDWEDLVRNLAKVTLKPRFDLWAEIKKGVENSFRKKKSKEEHSLIEGPWHSAFLSVQNRVACDLSVDTQCQIIKGLCKV